MTEALKYTLLQCERLYERFTAASLANLQIKNWVFNLVFPELAPIWCADSFNWYTENGNAHAQHRRNSVECSSSGENREENTQNAYNKFDI